METCSSAMSTRVKQRAVIEFLTAEKVTPTEIHRRLKGVYGDDAVDRSTVNRWAIKFRGCEPGKAIIVDETRSGRPITATDDKHRQLVDDLIQNDRRITQQRIANHVGISKERVGVIIQQLGYRKICARWVPRRLTDEDKQRRMECCQQLLQRYRDEGDDFLLNIVTGDESWVHHYEPEEKRQSAEYRHLSSPRTKKFKTQPSAKKFF
ncbi:histone-lysine n-methyltransferase setmar-like protein [Lasius niger]|uniref:Histone-lysine n-methyltransferase setmar-like protein n=1 Tax=Lasius niger TaxID=67767 RepID=A0A0J7JWW9_LASNI|nr:histone-lysine n-methyltransferase setmar-like protein [Lasius niger]